MLILKNKLYYRLLSILSRKRRKQLYLLLILLIINGLFESLSVTAISSFLSIASSGNSIDSIQILSKFANLLNIKDHSDLFLISTILFCTLIIFSTILRIFNVAYISRLSAVINVDLSHLMFKNNMYKSYYKYTKSNSSELVSLALEKVVLASSAINSLLTVISSSVLGISIIVSLFIVNWKILLIGIVFLLFYYLLIYGKLKKVLYENGQLVSKLMPLRIAILSEAFQGFRDIIINGTEEIYINLFKQYDSKIKFLRAYSDVLFSIPRFLIDGIVLYTYNYCLFFIFF